MKTRLRLFLILLLSLSANIYAQTKTNLDLIYKLIDNSLVSVNSAIGEKSIALSITTSQPLEVLKPKIIKSFIDVGYILKPIDDSGISLNYNLIYAKVEYKNSFTNGLFGGALIEREVSINGMLTAVNSNKANNPVEFNKSVIDTVKVDDITKIENQSLPFTQAQVPSMPLLSNLWEPIVVVGTLIVTVILLFTVRSK